MRATSDPHIRSLARLFREHPAWRAAAQHIAEGASSKVFFSHRPDDHWHLVRRDGQSLILPGAAHDPDLAFRFTPIAIQRLAEAQGDLADIAVVLFDLIANDDEDVRIGFRVVAPFWRLARHGYLGLLVIAGPKLVAYGVRHGLRTLADLQRLIAASQASAPAEWEREAPS